MNNKFINDKKAVLSIISYIVSKIKKKKKIGILGLIRIHCSRKWIRGSGMKWIRNTVFPRSISIKGLRGIAWAKFPYCFRSSSAKPETLATKALSLKGVDKLVCLRSKVRRVAPVFSKSSNSPLSVRFWHSRRLNCSRYSAVGTEPITRGILYFYKKSNFLSFTQNFQVSPSLRGISEEISIYWKSQDSFIYCVVDQLR